MKVRSKKIRRYLRQMRAESHATGARAFTALARLGWRARPALTVATTDPEPRVRYRAAIALGKMGDRRALPTLLALLADLDGDVRYEAAWALGELGDPRAVPPLVALFREEPGDDGLQNAAANALVELGAPAVEPLLGVLRSGSREARHLAAYTLGGIGDPAGIEPLAILLGDPEPGMRTAAVESLAAIGGSRCRALIEPRQQDSDERVRRNAAYWVREMGRPWDPWWCRSQETPSGG